MTDHGEDLPDHPSSLYEVMIGDVTITLIIGAEDDDETIDDLDVMVTYADGSRFSATMITLEVVDRLMRTYEQTEECLDGRFFQSRDLVLLRRGGVPEILDIITKLIETDELRYTFQDIGPESE